MPIADAIDEFTAAALSPADWPRALDRVSEALGAAGATLVLGRAERASVAISGSITSIVDAYFRDRVADTREVRVRPHLNEGFRLDFDDFTPQEVARDPYYQEFLAAYGFGYHAVARLSGGDDPLVLSLKRPMRFGHYDGHELDALARVLPHLRAAARTASAVWRASFDGQLDAFARIGVGAVLLDRRGRVVAVNSAAALGDAVDIRGGALVALLPEDRAALGRAIHAATSDTPAHDMAPLDPLPIRRLGGRRPVIADVTPIRGAHQSLLAPAVAIVLLRDLERRAEPPVELVRRTFGLTPREAELAVLLARGISLQAAAETLAISQEHARQRLKVVFAKTGTGRQADLISLLGRIG